MSEIIPATKEALHPHIVRKRGNMPVAEFAKQIGVSRQHGHKVANGEVMPGPEARRKLGLKDVCIVVDNSPLKPKEKKS